MHRDIMQGSGFGFSGLGLRVPFLDFALSGLIKIRSPNGP